MQISIERGALLKALSHQQSLIERRGSIPVLSHVLLETKPTCLSLTGTDLEISLVEWVPARVQQEGAFTVPVHIFHDIVKKLPESNPIAMTLTPESHVQISSGAVEFKIPTLPAEDFPKIHPRDLPVCLQIPASHLKQLIEDTRFAMSTEEARYSLNGIYFHNHENQWRAVATDAHRLALSWLPIPLEALHQLPNVIVGRKTIQEISKLLDECTQVVSLSLSAHQLVLTFEGCTFSSRLLEGQFPDYWQAIPKNNHSYVITMDVEALEQAVARVGMVSADKQRVIKLSVAPKELTLSAYSQQYGSAMEKLLISYEGDPFFLGFNPRYFLDICQHIKGSKIRMIFKDGLSPALFEDPEDKKVSFVLMPVRV